MILVIHGQPQPWTAARISSTRRAYSPHFERKQQVKWQLKAQYNKAPVSTPIRVSYAFHFEPPKWLSKIKRTQMLNGIIHHTHRPDLDNLQKFLSDCLTGIVWEDDSQMIECTSIKLYGETSKSVITILP